MSIKTLLKKWPLLAVTAIMLIALVAITSPAVGADPPTSGPHTMVVRGAPGSLGSYVDVSIDGGPWLPGWCVDSTVYISTYTPYSCTLYDYFGDYYPNDTALPVYIKRPHVLWNQVAYILNNKVGDWADIQCALWHESSPYGEPTFLNGGYPHSLANYTTMKTNADTLGTNFVPGAGQLKPIVCDAGSGIQVIFYEFETPTPPLPEMPSVLLLGLGLLGLGGFVLGVRRYKVLA